MPSKIEAQLKLQRGAKLTKRERKLLNGPNHATIQSLNHGEKQDCGMVGQTPKYGMIKNPKTGVESVQKVAAGIPFVNPSNFGLSF
jgi:hypothetical protein